MLYRLNHRVIRKRISLISICSALILTVVTSVFFLQQSAHNADALSGNEFKAGNIIVDSVFFDGGRMTAGDVQNFLNAKVPNCDTWGTKMHSTGRTTRAAHGAANGNPAPYTCLRDYRQNTPSMPLESGLCNQYNGGANKTAAQIISEVGLACGVNPQSLLVLLQKEQSLVTDDWPWQNQYTKATGFGCPDTAPCDPSYGGFFYQVYYAARQFKKYARDNTQYGYRANRNNYIQYNPNASCGGSNVYIENQATAGLYVYTPYQPNQAALNNLYGTGDGCSAYGNRNFWRMFNDWFGSTSAGSFLVRTAANAQVYLIVEDKKHPINDNATVESLPFKTVGFVSQAYLDAKTTSRALGRTILSPDGAVYYFDSAIKLLFSSCGLVADYGSSCEQAVTLTDYQIQSFVTGPPVTTLYRTTSGKSFYIKSGQKHEVYDEQALSSAGIVGGYNVLLESGIAGLPYGQPIVRSGTMISDRGSSKTYLYDSGRLFSSSVNVAQSGLKYLASRPLDSSSIGKLSPDPAVVNGLFQDQATGDKYALGLNGKMKLLNPIHWTNTYVLVSSATLSTIPTTNAVAEPYLIKNTSTDTVYYLENGRKRAISSWDDVLRISASPNIITTTDSTVASIVNGVEILPQGRLIKSPTSGAVYYADGLNDLIPLTTFLPAQERGVSMGIIVRSQSTIDQYTLVNSSLGIFYKCNNLEYVGIGGRVYRIPSNLAADMGISYVTESICPGTSTALLGNYFLAPNGAIYLIENGKKRPFAGYGAYIAKGGTSGNTLKVSDYVLSVIPTGPVIY